MISTPTALRARLRRTALIVGLVLVTPMLSACTQEDIDWLFAIGEEWGRANGVIDEAGNINYGQAVMQVFGVPSGDSLVDAALDAGSVVANLEDAERLAREGIESGDIAKVEAAIEARTKDWGFHEQKAGLLMAQGDFAGADRAFADSESLVRDQISKGGDCRLLARNIFTHRINALETQLSLQPNDQLRSKAAETQSQLDALAANRSISFCS
ncbi:MAG: hypothetical protein J4N82_07265 [Chloroflexi bacterium]|nr:hypothetical protein [Chloroflexota bacterium]